MQHLYRTAALALTASVVTSSSLPYNPTKIILPSNSSYAYILDPASSTTESTKVLAFNVSQTIDTSKDLSSTSDTGAPLGTSTYGQAINLIQDTNGDLIVISGNCTAGASSTQAWRYILDQESSAGSGTWTQAQVTGQQGLNFLSDGMAFSGQSNGANSSIYLFAGMCPTSDTVTSNWTTEATYSANLLELSQAGSNIQYTESAIVSRGGPVPEAGFTITTLPTTGSGNSLQQQFLLVGGHTQSAFINMSQVAVFTLPQQTWSFLPIQQSASAQVEPRSGHTAVLTEDGSKIVVFGGWVGDTNTPATPQLAILELGTGYGGNGPWKWTVPDMTGYDLSLNGSVYGHGAAILPGNIMLVSGGYGIAGSLSKRAMPDKRTQPLLFNASSYEWIQSYTTPSTILPGSKLGSSSSMTGPKIGLAVGLTLGLLILLALLIFYFWYARKTKRQSQERERNLMSRSSDGSYTHISQPFLEKNSIDGRGGEMTAANHYWNGPNLQPTEHSAATGLYTNQPSPTRGLRKGMVPRNYQYHAAPRYDDKRASRGSGNIHPIAEIDDEDASQHRGSMQDDNLSEAQRQLKEVEAILMSNRDTTRFRTTPTQELPDPLRSHPVSPEIGESSRNTLSEKRAPRSGSPNWKVASPFDDDADSGRVSPTKTDDRTSSTLSDRSHRSMFSDNSITRTMSTRTGALLAAVAAAQSRARAIEDESSSSDARTSTMSTTGRTSPVSKRTIARSSTNGSRSAGADAESFRTARSGFPARRTEGETLLGGAVALDRDDPYRRALAADETQMYTGPRRRGILGSLRKAIGVVGDRTMSLASSRGGYETDQLHSATSSPTKERRNPTDAPRRAVSDGGALLRQKRGRLDWAENQFPPYHDDPDPGDWGEPTRTSTEREQAEEDWDVENAAAKRDVQIMFTVPKSRLRVVNADMDRASLRSVSDGVLSRAGSVRALRREESKGALRVRSDDKEKLSTMPEIEHDDKNKIL